MKISVHVKPAAKVDAVEVADNVYVVRTKARAVDGKANEAVIKLLSAYLNVSKTHVRIVRGTTSNHKIIDVTD